MYVRHEDHKDEFGHIHQHVERVLDAIDNATLLFNDIFLKQLGDYQVGHPQTCKIIHKSQSL